ncbi:MAG: 4Fe-4S binding protein [Spirochaetaceae bacterium]|nr:4Fe-4S binding protein [Spirochaetaceae bacterium]
MKNNIAGILRIILLTLFLIFITYTAYMHQVKGGGPDGSPSIHALCPFGGLESLYTLFTAGNLIDKIYVGTFSLFIISLVLALIFRRGFCGWICPLGALQEWTGRLGKKIMGRSWVMPLKLDSVLRYLKYPVLILIISMTAITASLWVSPHLFLVG